jgi:predicted kinase
MQCLLMEAVIFVGIQGSGKSTFFKRTFADTHVRINLDMLRTRFREKALLEACLAAKQRFVVDKVNLTKLDRAKYVSLARSHGFNVVGYYFQTDLSKALERNRCREGTARIPEKGLLGAAKRLEIPRAAEGFDQVFYVWIDDNDQFVVEPWRNEV